jgi:ubiquinone/menaquinone biosynthesis C-methylase UbiE
MTQLNFASDCNLSGGKKVWISVIPSESADFMVFNMVLADNYLTTKNKKAILAEIVRVLKPGGYLVGQTGLGPKTIRQYFDEVKIGGSTFYRRK